MNNAHASLKEKQKLLLSIFLKSLFYTIPVGMFLTASNCLFESVRSYYFDWLIVILPTVAICAIGNLYETIFIYQLGGLFTKKETAFNPEKTDYSVSNSNLVTF